jgi:hypothetical protein
MNFKEHKERTKLILKEQGREDISLPCGEASDVVAFDTLVLDQLSGKEFASDSEIIENLFLIQDSASEEEKKLFSKILAWHYLETLSKKLSGDPMSSCGDSCSCKDKVH